MSNDEYYNEDAACMQEEYYDEDMQEELCDTDALNDSLQEEYNSNLIYDEIHDAYYDMKTAQPQTEQDLIISDNWDNCEALLILMKKKPFLNFLIGIEDGLPYYQTELYGGLQRKIYITKEIRRLIYNYLKNGDIPDKLPEVYDVYKNMDETFLLHHYKKDYENKVTTYSLTSKEHWAMYKYGIIRYIQLPYSTDELKTKINSL